MFIFIIFNCYTYFLVMSLLHKPEYVFDYDESDDSEGLSKLLWSQFMCKCGKCSVKTGKNFMERLPVYILDEIAKEERMRMDIELAYVCKQKADKMPLPTKDPHRAGLAVKIRVVNAQKRIRLIRGLIVRGVTRIGINDKFVYYDTDDLREMGMYMK